MCEATHSALDCGWMDKGVTSLDQHLWDATPDREGYYNQANLDFTSPWDKGFTPTVDGITTHGLHNYLISGRGDYRSKFLLLADASQRMAANTAAPGVTFGFPEDYFSDWSINGGSHYGFVGHLFKTAWCLARAYMVSPEEKYRSAARQVLLQMWSKGGFDRVNGAPNYDFYWNGGVASHDKEYWQIEQGFTSGITNWYIATSDADRAVFLEMADRSLDFYMRHLVDTQFGGIFFQTNADGSAVVRQDKGDQWEGAYHDVELAYYAYLDSNLLFWRRPATLYYRFDAAAAARTITLSPIPIVDGRLRIASVTHGGAPYAAFDSVARTLTIPAGSSGVFAVTFIHTEP
jgi:mannose/cellobiose epimerase-like protein (N-acyl-D-glucosamine 2-epimerase family)